MDGKIVSILLLLVVLVMVLAGLAQTLGERDKAKAEADRVANAFESYVAREFDPACWKDGEAGTISAVAYHNCKAVAHTMAKRVIAKQITGRTQ